MIRLRNWGLACAATLLLAAASVSSFAQAQPGAPGQGNGGQGGGRGQGRGRMGPSSLPLEFMDHALQLTADQKLKISNTLDTFHAAQKAAQGDGTGQPDRRAEGAARQTADKEIEDVLTDEQKLKLPDIYTTVRMYGMVGIPVGALHDLKLTADQKAKIKTISEDTQTKTRDALQQNSADRQAGFAAMQAARKEGTDKVQALLTAPQKTMLAKYIADHPDEMRGMFGGFGRGRRPGGNPPPAPGNNT